MHGYRCVATDVWLPTCGYQTTVLVYQCFEDAWLPNNLILEGLATDEMRRDAWLPMLGYETT
ncbi:hypothetical protein [Scytonema sp. PCC 10023]|uniref:hypothetical protein n=1 Tax=Scytonema sp. PCC 10023 TaxID=1680591 RepID=UPI0039C6830B